MTEVLNLIKQQQGVDDYGDPVITETTRQVFCRAQSIGAKEFYQAQATGLKPEIKFILTDYLEHQGEELLEFNGTRYRILRTYRTGQELEITAYTEVNT